MLKILIADDHTIVREGLKQILADMSETVTTEDARTGQEVLEKIGKNHFDLVLLDISMPGRSGLEVLEQLKKERSALPVLILSMYSEEHYAIRAFRSGASGYLTKESTPHELISAIQKVIQGKKYVSSSLAERLTSYIDKNIKHPAHETLSNREIEVMCMIASGKTVSDIAEALSLSVKTISTYRTRILEKMGLDNNAQLTQYAFREGLIFKE
jgi:DNA-binding NarL/FixJ family response regulator